MRKIRQWQLGMISVGMWSSDCLRGGRGDGGRIKEKAGMRLLNSALLELRECFNGQCNICDAHRCTLGTSIHSSIGMHA